MGNYDIINSIEYNSTGGAKAESGEIPTLKT
jgi:hypothetical protein